MHPWILVAGFVLVVVSRWIGMRWFARRWLADGMSPTRAAIWSLAITHVPIVVFVFLIAALSAPPLTLGGAALLLAVLSLPSLMWFGLRRAVFDYMDNYGVKAELQRQQRKQPSPPRPTGSDTDVVEDD